MPSLFRLAVSSAVFAALAPCAVAQPTSRATAASAQQAPDETDVVLEGTLVRALKRERYEFKDASGTVTVEIDNDRWPARKVELNRPVRLHGEVDRNRSRVEVDVKLVELLP